MGSSSNRGGVAIRLASRILVCLVSLGMLWTAGIALPVAAQAASGDPTIFSDKADYRRVGWSTSAGLIGLATTRSA